MAVIVMAMALTTALSVMQRAFLNLDTARNLQIAGSIMQTEIEKERLFSWIQLNDATYQPAIDSSFMRNPAVAGRFTLSRTTSLLTAYNSQLVQVTLSVTWRTHDGRSLIRSYTTYFGRGGLHNYIYENV